MSRLALDQDALALLAFERYLAADLQHEPQRSRLIAEMKRDEARKRTVAVTLKISPPAAEQVDVVIVAERVGAGTSTPIKVSNRKLERGEQGPVLRLEPGSWTLTLTRPGYQPARQVVELVVDNPAVLEVTMALDRVPEVAGAAPPRTVDAPESSPAAPRKLMLGLVAGGGVLAGAGVGVLVGGVVSRRSLAVCEPPATIDCQQDLASALRLRDAGAGVLGAGLGVLAGALTGLAPELRTRRTLQIAGAAIGGVALVGGAAWLTTSSRAFNRANGVLADDWSAHYAATSAGPHAAAACMFGVGVGLALGVGASLIGEHSDRRKRSETARSLRLDPAAGPRGAMLRISGRF